MSSAADEAVAADAAAARPATGRRYAHAATGGRATVAAVVLVLVAAAAALAADSSAHALGQATINGLVSAGYIALGAVGLTLVFGTLRVINFAQGEYLTAGAYFGIVAHETLHLEIVVAVLFAVAATTALSVGLEFAIWRPVRRRGAGPLQLLIVALGLGFLMRYTIQFIFGPDYRRVGVDVSSSYSVAGLQIGKTELVAMLGGFAAIAAVAAMLRFTFFGKRARALSDDVDLAETTGIDTRRMTLAVWALAGALAGLGGMLYAASVGSASPNTGFAMILSLFAAVIVGGVGNAYGALAAGLLIGVVEDWSTIVVSPALKTVVGFAVMVIVLILRPKGLFARHTSADRA